MCYLATLGVEINVSPVRLKSRCQRGSTHFRNLESLLLGIFQLLETTAFLDTWPLSPSSRNIREGHMCPVLIHVDAPEESIKIVNQSPNKLKIIFLKASSTSHAPSICILCSLLSSCFPFYKRPNNFLRPYQEFWITCSSKDFYLSQLQSPFCHETC